MPDDLRPLDLFPMAEAQRQEVAISLRKFMPLFQRYLLVGGFPETARHPDVAFCQRLLREDVVERVLKRDMTTLFQIRNVEILERLFIYLCLHTGGILSNRTCADALGTNQATLASYLHALEQANLAYRLPLWGKGGKTVLRGRHKVYLADAALRNAVLLRGEEILQDPDEMGTIVETTVLRHLYAYHYRDTPEILYWRDSASGKEVDIIVRSPTYVIPVEVKFRQKAALDRQQGIHRFCLQERPRFAYWVTQRESDFDLHEFADLDTPILRVPAHIFTYLLGQAERLLWMR